MYTITIAPEQIDDLVRMNLTARHVVQWGITKSEELNGEELDALLAMFSALTKACGCEQRMEKLDLDQMNEVKVPPGSFVQAFTEAQEWQRMAKAHAEKLDNPGKED